MDAVITITTILFNMNNILDYNSKSSLCFLLIYGKSHSI